MSRWISILLLWHVLLGCAEATKPASGKIKTFVSIPPLSFFVERVAGPFAEVNVMVDQGQDAHTYEPTPQQMSSLAESQFYFSIGLPFEETLLPKIIALNHSLKVIDANFGIRRRIIGTAESADPEHAGLPDPHTWLDPRLAKIQAQNIESALAQFDPSHVTDYQANLQALHNDLDRLDANLAGALKPYRGQTILVFHPAFGYFCDAYGLVQMAVEIEGQEPSARQLADLIEKAKAKKIQIIFAQPQFSTVVVRRIAESIGAAVAPMNDLAPDYLENLQNMADRIAQQFRR